MSGARFEIISERKTLRVTACVKLTNAVGSDMRDTTGFSSREKNTSTAYILIINNQLTRRHKPTRD